MLFFLEVSLRKSLASAFDWCVLACMTRVCWLCACVCVCVCES